MKLSELRPCDNCGGQVQPFFYVLRYSIALFKPTATRQTLGLMQMFNGALALAEAMSPEPEVVTVAMDDPESKALMVELRLCQECFMSPICLAEIGEQVTARGDKQEASE
jgi:hypothetical protein